MGRQYACLPSWDSEGPGVSKIVSRLRTVRPGDLHLGCVFFIFRTASAATSMAAKQETPELAAPSEPGNDDKPS